MPNSALRPPTAQAGALTLAPALGNSTSTSSVETFAPRSTFTCTFSGSTLTWPAHDARISWRSTATRSDWLMIRRSYSSKIWSRSRATGAELRRRAKLKLKNLMPPSARTAG